MRKLLLPLLFLASCNIFSTKYPRVVKNGCGTFAVQMSEDEKSGAVRYLGVITYRPHYECYDTGNLQLGGRLVQTTTISVSGFYVIGDCGYDTTNVDVIRSRKRAAIWGDIKDTSYAYVIGHELQFKTEAQAAASMNSYLRRTREYNAFADSVTLCHTYK